MDTYADDLAELFEALDLKKAIHDRPLHRRRRGGPLHRPPRHEARRQGGADGRGAAAHAEDRRPIPAGCRWRSSTASAPASWPTARSSSRTSPAPVLRLQPAGRQGLARAAGCVLDAGDAGRLKNAYDCIKAFSETDFTEDLKKFDVPTLIIHGDDDQIVPIGASAMLSSKLVKNAVLKIYQGGSHGICSIQKDEVNADLLAFFKE